jgi:hypothetical protein
MKYKIVFLVFMFLAQIQTFAKLNHSPSYADAGSWNTFNITLPLNKKWNLLFTEELRFRENYGRLNLFYTNLGAEYKVNSYIKTSLVYRWINKYTDENRFSFRHRIMWDANFKYSFRKYSISYRHRLQIENRNIYTSEAGFKPEYYSRNRFELAHQTTKKISPYLNVEFRYDFHDPRNVETDKTWHRVRFQGGIDCKFSKQSKFGIYYLAQFEYNVSAPENIFITGLEYSSTLKKDMFKRKKKDDIDVNPFAN